MERASEDHFGRASLRHEHIHRYQLAALLARRVVVDCACGIGYGSEIITAANAVESYLGIDPSQEAIEYARQRYVREHVQFETGTLELNSLANSSVDSFLMFETLEHTENPFGALESVRRCLKPDGLLIGSVPSAEYEDLCTTTYGLNPFHLQKFTKTELVKLLSEHFEKVYIFSMEFLLGSLLRPTGSEMSRLLEIATDAKNHEDIINGSIVFVAGSTDAVSHANKILGSNGRFFPSISKVVLDREEVNPIRFAVQSMEAMIRDRDEAIAGQARMLEERWAAMKSMEAMIRERDESIAGQARILEDRWTAMQSMEAMVRARDESIVGQAKMLEERWAAMQSMEAMVRARDESIAGQAKMLEERWAAMQSMEAMIRERDKVIIDQWQLLEKRPNTIEAMVLLLSAVSASFQYRVGRILRKNRRIP